MAMVLFEDNQGVLMMANDKQPTRRTHQFKTSQFALLDWVERDLLEFKFVESSDNASDAMTKSLARILHYNYFDRMMGRIIPEKFRTNNSDLKVTLKIKKN